MADTATRKCEQCGKSKPLKAFKLDGRRSDNLDPTCMECRGMGEELETQDIDGVAILAVGGPFYGKGSPKEGDFFDEEKLEAMAAANNDLAEEVRVPLKIGHSSRQQLLANSGLVGDDEMPAAGWLENFRVEGGKLLADIKDVPAKLAALIKSKAFRTRSVELQTHTKQDGSGKRYEMVVTALALLGAKLPAVKTLDDIAALYADLDEDGIRTIDYAEEGAIVWRPQDGYEWIRSAISRALNGEPSGPGPDMWKFWVRDLASGKALVEEYGADHGEGAAWVVPFAIAGDRVELSGRDDWTLARQEWVAAAKGYREGTPDEPLKDRRAPADMGEDMPDTLTLNSSQLDKFAEILGVERDQLPADADELMKKLAEAQETPPAPDGEPDPDPNPGDPKPDGEPAPTGVSLSQDEVTRLQADAQAGREAAEELRVTRRDSLIETAMREGKIAPADRETWQKAYDADATQATTLIATLAADESRATEFGSDDPGTESDEAMLDKLETQLAQRHGVQTVSQILGEES